jgi:DNA-binding response OmpR family regulator
MKILIVDDDVMLADLLEAELLDQGHEVCGVTTNVAEAVGLVRLHRPDIAVLDMKLKGTELGSDIAHRLAEAGDLRDLGILYVTGGVDFLHQHAGIGHACLQKPYSVAALTAALPIVRSIARGCAISGALPHGMQLLGLPQTA